MKLYFGHPVNAYNTELEKELIRIISEKLPGWEIENPNQPHHDEGYQVWKARTGNGMDYYTLEVLPSCHGGIFLPFRYGAWGAGVYTEGKFYAERGLPVFEISPMGAISSPDFKLVIELSVPGTRARIRDTAGNVIPY